MLIQSGAEMMINPTTFFSGIQKNIEEYYKVPRTEVQARFSYFNIFECWQIRFH